MRGCIWEIMCSVCKYIGFGIAKAYLVFTHENECDNKKYYCNAQSQNKAYGQEEKKNNTGKYGHKQAREELYKIRHIGLTI